MKDKVFKELIFAIFFTGMIIACQKEIVDKPDDSAADIMQAKIWYESIYSPELVMKSLDFSKGKLKVKPDWNLAFISNHGDSKTVEVPLSTQGRFGFATQESKQAYKETGDNRFLQSLTTIVVEKKGNKTIGFLMTIIPDKDYRVAKDFKALLSSYKKWQKGFSGFVLYHELDGRFSNGWKLSEGKVVSTVKRPKGTDIKIQLQSSSKSCSDYYMVEWFVWCTTWYTNDRWVSTECGEPFQEANYLYSVCTEDGGAFGGGGDGGGDGGGEYVPPEDPPEQPCEGDPLLNMRVASSYSSGVMGGMYGCVRLGETDCDPDKVFHHGIDIACSFNSPIYSMKGGEVIYVSKDLDPGEQSATNTLGNYVKVRYTAGDGSTTDILYGHLNCVYATVGESINSGDMIGLSGNTGNAGSTYASEPHVHIRILQDDNETNPTGYFNSYISSSGIIESPCNPYK